MDTATLAPSAGLHGLQHRAARAAPPACSAELAGRLGQLQWLQVALEHEVGSLLDWPEFGGHLWHGVFGLALHQADPQAYAALYGGGDDSVRGWALQPPQIDGPDWLPAGTRLASRICLSGPLMAHAGACVAAFEAFGQLGLGSGRVPVRLAGVALDGPQGRCRPGDAAGVWNGLDVWHAAVREADAGAGLLLRLRSPLRIKDSGRLLMKAPSLEVLLRRCMARIGRLQADADEAGTRFMAEGEKSAWLDWAAAVPLTHAQTRPLSLTRYSGRQRREMNFDGFDGAWRYAAPAAQALPWLRLGQALQIGSKTTFGFGRYDCTAVPPGSGA